MKVIMEITDKQAEALDLMAQGKFNKEIAAELGLHERSVEQRLSRAYKGLGVKRRVSAAFGYYFMKQQQQQQYS